MNIGIYTYGTRGDVQPYIALALGLLNKGHSVTIAAPENFKDFVESFGVPFHPLHGNAEDAMNSAEGRLVLASENTIKLMKFFFHVLHAIRVPLRKSYWDSISKVDFIIANSATLTIVTAIAQKQNKKVALTYFMPPVVPTAEFPLSDFDFLNFKWYNKLTYKLAHSLYWKFVKAEVNEFRAELDLPLYTSNMLVEVEKQHWLDLYCISPSLIPRPADWAANHKITGFLTIPARNRETANVDEISAELKEWLDDGSKPIYMGFGSNGVGNSEKFANILQQVLANTNERILFCTGWAKYHALPEHKNLFVTKYANHEAVLPKCKIGIFHGGAGTLAAMLRNGLPVIIISFYTDQPAWGKIIAGKGAGAHIPLKKLTAAKLIKAIAIAQTAAVKQNASNIGEQIRSENGLENAVNEIESYFTQS